MSAILLAHTPNPERVVAAAARLCYAPVGAAELMNEMSGEEVAKLLGTILKSGHLSVCEHATFSFGIEGISRACSHQLVRHRVASYSQQSQRYVKLEQFEYIMPPSIKEDPALVREFEQCMADAQENYTKVLKRLEELGYKGESGQQ